MWSAKTTTTQPPSRKAGIPAMPRSVASRDEAGRFSRMGESRPTCLRGRGAGGCIRSLGVHSSTGSIGMLFTAQIKNALLDGRVHGEMVLQESDDGARGLFAASVPLDERRQAQRGVGKALLIAALRSVLIGTYR